LRVCEILAVRNVSNNSMSSAAVKAATSPKMQGVINQRNSIGNVASFKVGAQVAGAQLSLFKGNNYNLSAGFTFGQVKTEFSTSGSGTSNTTSFTALKAGVQAKSESPQVKADATVSVATAKVTTSDNGKSETSFSPIDGNANAKIGISGASATANTSGDTGFEVSAGNVTVGASVNKENFSSLIGNFFEAAKTYINEIYDNATHPERHVTQTSD
jgi:hypothetical protein